MKKTIILATAVAASLASGIAAADVTATAGAFSNYIFRGTTYSGDSAVVQGSMDWKNDMGLYTGAWISTLGSAGLGSKAGLAGNGEIDLYGGFSSKVGGLGYDLGAITYQYTSAPTTNYTEVYASGTFSIITAGLNYTVDAASANKDAAFDSGDIYYHIKADFAAGPMDASIYAGSYQFTNNNKFGNGHINYNHIGASLSKNGFSLAVDKNDVKPGNKGVGDNVLSTNMDAVRFTVSYSKDFQL